MSLEVYQLSSPVLCDALCVLHAHPFPVVFGGIAVIFGPTKATVTTRKKYNSGRAKSDDAVAANIQMTGAKY